MGNFCGTYLMLNVKSNLSIKHEETVGTCSHLVSTFCHSSSARKKKQTKALEREKMQKQKDLFWFKVGDDETDACKNVDESSVQIIPGPPGDSCKEDEERFCFCGKKGSGSTNWKFICGTCYANKPFSFKIERPDDPHSLKLSGEKLKQKLD